MKRSQVPLSTIQRAVSVIREGGVVLYPTDTVYGLGCDPFNPEALRRVIRIKGRADDKGMIILINSWADLDRVAQSTVAERDFAKRYWPGPVTIVCDAKAGLPRLLTGGKKTIAVRWPRDPFLQSLLKKLGGPVVSTSANLTGQPGTTRFTKAAGYFKNNESTPDLLINAGSLPVRQPSTIVRRKRKGFHVLRQGDIHIT